MSIDALADHLGRPYGEVHEALRVLEQIGLLDHSAESIRAPADKLTVEMVLYSAQVCSCRLKNETKGERPEADSASGSLAKLPTFNSKSPPAIEGAVHIAGSSNWSVNSLPDCVGDNVTIAAQYPISAQRQAFSHASTDAHVGGVQDVQFGKIALSVGPPVDTSDHFAAPGTIPHFSLAINRLAGCVGASNPLSLEALRNQVLIKASFRAPNTIALSYSLRQQRLPLIVGFDR